MDSDEIRNCDPERVYRINYVDYTFVSGRHPNGEQVLIGDLDEQLLVALFFSPEGRYLRNELLPVPRQDNPALPRGHQNLEHYAALREAKHRWMADLGMAPADIHIRHFSIPEWGIGTAEWPKGYFADVQRALAEGDDLDDIYLVGEWRQQRRWVMNWKQEYWMTADGDIGDT